MKISGGNIPTAEQEYQDAIAVPPPEDTGQGSAPVASPKGEAILESKDYHEPGTRERSRLPVPERATAAASSSSRHVSGLEPDSECTPPRSSTHDATDDLPQQLRDHFTRVKGGWTRRR